MLLAEGDEIGPQAIMLQGAAVGGRNSGHHGAETKRALVGRTVAEAERHLILDTLRPTLGNSTHAASILGIAPHAAQQAASVRRCGVPIPPPGGGGSDAGRDAA